MGILDIIIIFVILISGLLALYRGLVRELLGLITWLLAAFGAFYGLVFARPLFRKMINNPTVADIVAAVVIALFILIVCTIINAKINEKLRKSVLSGLDRILGFVFGIFRGALLILLVYFFAAFALSSETIEKYANDNFSVSYLQKTVPMIEKMLPENLMKGLKDMRSENKQTSDAKTTEEEIKAVKAVEEEKQAVPYEEKDLDSMDNLLESIKE